MSTALRLLPCEHWHEQPDGKVWGLSHTILELGDIWEEAFEAFEAPVKPHLAELPAGHDVTAFTAGRVPEGNYYAGETIYGRFRAEDGYGVPYMVGAARHFLPWLTEHFVYDGQRGGPYQTAIVAYVRALPPDTKIILDWH